VPGADDKDLGRELGDAELLDAFDHFVTELVRLLNEAKVATPPGAVTEIVAGALIVKILRLGDSVLGLCRARHGNETGLVLRTLLLAFANMKFIARHPNREGAALRFMRHLRYVRTHLEEELVRPDVEGEGFPVQAPEAWASDEAELDRQWQQIDAWAPANNVIEIAPARPPDRKGQRRPPLPWSWTGLSEGELFTAVEEPDAYRFYAWFSNEVHSNVVGLGELFTAINKGRVDLNDETDFLRGPLAMAAKYLIRSLELYEEIQGLQIANAIAEASDAFSGALTRYRPSPPTLAVIQRAE
jgi:hypothetical protein